MKLLLIGSTSPVGQNVLRLALRDPRIDHIVAPARNLYVSHPKLLVPVVNFNELPADAPWWSADSVICALSTTRKIGEKEKACCQTHRDYPLAVARLSKKHGTAAYVLSSSHGAHPESPNPYFRLKGELEHELTKLGFSSLSYIHPGVIDHNECSLADRIMVRALTLLEPILPRELRLNPASNIANALIESAILAQPGVHAVTPKTMVS